VQGSAGADTMIGSNGVGVLTHFTFEGAGGDDSLMGTDGGDSLDGGAGDDTISGGRGNDTVNLGPGVDIFVWNPGDGSDSVDGGNGSDTVLFNGANIAETFDLSAQGGGFAFTRNVAAITLTGSSVETLDLVTRGGVDIVNVHDLTGSGLRQLSIDLGGNPGTGVGDGASDTVAIEGSSLADRVIVTAGGGTVTVQGLSETVALSGAEGDDLLLINGGAGDDSISAAGAAAGQIRLQLAGAAGDDTLAGGHGDDTLTGGAGDDRFSFGAQGGHDLITDFQAHGAGAHGDVVALSGFPDRTFATALANHHIVQVGLNVDITDGANVIVTLANVTLATLHANDFVFG
jgi:Ca2+-binding RTX toxin-like protein